MNNQIHQKSSAEKYNWNMDDWPHHEFHRCYKKESLVIKWNCVFYLL